MIPNHAANPDAAKEFILHLVANYNQAVFNSALYNFPAFATTSPQLVAEGGWLDVDPFGSRPVDKLKLLKDAESWSTVIGHPGPPTPAAAEVEQNWIIPLMIGQAVQSENVDTAVDWATEKIDAIYAKYQ